MEQPTKIRLVMELKFTFKKQIKSHLLASQSLQCLNYQWQQFQVYYYIYIYIYVCVCVCVFPYIVIYLF